MSAQVPAATATAFMPETPVPMMTTLAGATPETPPMTTPRPPSTRARHWAPTRGGKAARDLTHRDSSGSEPSGSWTVSYAMDVVPAAMRARVHSWLAARCR